MTENFSDFTKQLISHFYCNTYNYKDKITTNWQLPQGVSTSLNWDWRGFDFDIVVAYSMYCVFA